MRRRWNPTPHLLEAIDGRWRDPFSLPIGAHSARDAEEWIQEHADVDVVELRRPVPDGARNQCGIFAIFLSLIRHHISNTVAVKRERIEYDVV